MAKKYCALPNLARLVHIAELLSARRPRFCMTSSRYMERLPSKGGPPRQASACMEVRPDGVDAAFDGAGGTHVGQWVSSTCRVEPPSGTAVGASFYVRCKWQVAQYRHSCAHLNETNAIEVYLPFYDVGNIWSQQLGIVPAT
ncbi:MAG: hypothetical protein ABI865_06490 [Nitrosospira sp.]